MFGKNEVARKLSYFEDLEKNGSKVIPRNPSMGGG